MLRGYIQTVLLSCLYYMTVSGGNFNLWKNVQLVLKQTFCEFWDLKKQLWPYII